MELAELPSGTVTLLFTDVEGSTSLLTRLRDGYEQVLADHRRLLRASFERAGGQVIDSQGDAFFVAFPRGKAALAAAVEAQRALVSHAWPKGSEVRVRMGITTGEPRVGKEGLIGLPVHRGARICAAAHGGQILLSGATQELVEDELPPGVSLRDLGQHRLRDLERVEHVFQVVIDGLPNEFPPLRTADARRGAAAPFEGLEADLETAARAAVATRLRRAPSFWAALRDKPVGLLVLTGLTLAAILLSPWIGIAAAAYGAWLLWSILRGLRFFRDFEWMGLRVHAMESLTSDEAVRGGLRRAGSGLIDLSRLERAADELLRAVDRKSLEIRLKRAREKLSLSEAELREADAIADAVTALDDLTARRRDVAEGREAIAERVEGLRAQMFEARRDPMASAAISQETDSLLKTVEGLRRTLRIATDQAQELHSPKRRSVRFASRRGRRPAASPTAGPLPGGRARAPSRRCFRHSPIGHHWITQIEGNHSWMECSRCGRTRGTTFRPGTTPPESGFGGSGSN